MRPAATRAATFSVLTFDQLLRARRGVKRWRNHSPSNGRRCPSIQPWQSAMSSASAWVTVGMPDAFFAILIHTPSSSAWVASQVAHASDEANAMTGRSSFTRSLAKLVGQHVHEQPVAIAAVCEPLVGAHDA